MYYFWVPFLPMLGIIIPLLTNKVSRSACALATAILPALALILILLDLPAVFAGHAFHQSIEWIPQLGLALSFRLDGLSALFSLLILGIGLLVILYARYYLSEKDNMGRFYCYLIMFMTAMLGIVMSNNMLQLWFYWELTSISSFLLIGFWSHSSDARKGARMALTITGAGGLALLAGIILLGQVVGSYELDVVLNSGELIKQHPYYLAILGLFLIGAFTKSAQFPFHFWLPHAMAAPTPVSAYLHSATMVKAGIFLLARFYPVLAGTETWFVVVSLTGLFTLLLGAYTALFKHDLKGLLAYSTISHLGLIVLLLGLNTELAAIAAIFHIMNHAIFKASLFMAAGIIDHESGSRDMRQLNGLWKYMPITATLAMVASASMAGVPLLNGFLSKEMFFAETLNQSILGSISWLIPVLATIAGAFAVAYSLRFIHDVFFNGEPKGLTKTPHEPPRYMRVPVEILVALCLVVGILPHDTIGPMLQSASLAVLNHPVPNYSLSLWHGFNIPLMMSGFAIAGGLAIYLNRQYLFKFAGKFPIIDAKAEFEGFIQICVKWAQQITEKLETGSLQRYAFCLCFFALLLIAPPLLELDSTRGSLAGSPINGAVIVAAVLIIAGSMATVIWSHYRLIALLMLSLVGLVVSITFAYFSAPDLALTQLSVEIVTVILLLLALYFFPQHTPTSKSRPSHFVRDMAVAALIGCIIGSICFALMTHPLDSISDFFLANAKTGGGGTNVVNVILVDFRGFDTFGEITVLGIAALGIHKLIAGMRLSMRTKDHDGRLWASDKYPMLLSVVSQSLLPLFLLISAYIFMRGHNLPGGGFIAGLITSIALIQQYLAHGVGWMTKRVSISYHYMTAIGLVTAGLTGLGSWMFGRPFLTSWFEYVSLPWIGKFELTSALVFDLGVYFTVIGATLLILASLGKLTTKERVKEGER
ncbi:monovalent cation/H+ antiporter subunit A [Psychromonas sp. psych-6C06]|uniref:monovalent cation/H+ antiporter subunit A n=1 Tax=Psychromonas sp. psych-6C06 TaxID=2058089 RepID=UPI000C34EC5C|nr:monovalent cation/H+ antiporter subunit A [Psychromonas sp. psych-6C06]PKF62478.1 monovalent cation/H+ antiporter subunit A [Psychromonas sp. psych-6C06]